MPQIDRTVSTDSSVERVWAFMSDFTTTQQWDPPTVTTERVSGDGGVGTQYQNTSRVFGHDTEILYTVVECRPPELLRLHGRSDSFEAVDTVTVSSVGAKTMVQYTADFTFRGATKLATPLLAVGLQKIGNDAEQQMQECLDSLG